MSNFKNGNKLKCVKEASEDAAMTIVIGWIGLYSDGNVYDESHTIPIIGIADISNCFEVV